MAYFKVVPQKVRESMKSLFGYLVTGPRPELETS